MSRKRVSAYTRNRNRILSYVRRQRKKGWNIDIDIPTERQLKKEGIKGIELSKYTWQLKKLTPAKIREFPKTLFEPSTGEVIAPTTISYDPTLYVDSVINAWLSEVEVFARAEGYSLLIRWTNTMIDRVGKAAFAQMITDGYAGGYILTREIAYKMDNTRNYLAEMIKFLRMQGEDFENEINLRVDEFITELSDSFEVLEDWELPT
nr:MAG TPA: hypothetical protein [Caudoviricetes sp.]